MNATLGYIALGLMAGLTFLAFVTACACVVLYFRFHNEPAEDRVGLRTTIFGGDEPS